MCCLLRGRVGGSTWTASSSDFEQYLTMDLGGTKQVTRIETQGRPHSSEYVMEYGVSYGSNGLDYADYKEPGGNTKVRRWKITANKADQATTMHAQLTSM